uniref:Uncharacterized protein n=1 Tax=Branchiostoma floridae TaxID=7739 RepID=C3Y3D5_BRAFL|eukprot:XP_002609192.1 hypothetical protein BRAFLDRAFT_125957 [Branchiostoma floridae]
MPPKRDPKQHRTPFSSLQLGLEALVLDERFCSNAKTELCSNFGETLEAKNNVCKQRKRKRALEDDVDMEGSLETRERNPEEVKTIPEALQCLKRLKTFMVREGHSDVLDSVLELENVLEEKWCEERLVRPSSKTVKQTTVTDFFRKRQL